MDTNSNTFTTMLKQYIPVLTDEDLASYEARLVYRDLLRKQLYMIPKQYLSANGHTRSNGLTKKANQMKERIRQLSDETNQFFARHHKRSYYAAHDLWIARRRFALEQGHFCQIPDSIDRLDRYIRAVFRYHWTAIRTLPVLWVRKWKYQLSILLGRDWSTYAHFDSHLPPNTRNKDILQHK